MANLRILNANSADSKTVLVEFSDNVSQSIVDADVQLIADEQGIPDSEVFGITVSENIVTLNVLPVTPFYRYKVIFNSTDTVKIQNESRSAFLLEDGISHTKPK
jgi:hypothetical protein